MDYRVRIRGRLGTTMLVAFPELRAQVVGPETLLTGQLPDQAALFSVLERIEALGLELLEVRTDEDPQRHSPRHSPRNAKNP